MTLLSRIVVKTFAKIGANLAFLSLLNISGGQSPSDINLIALN